MLKSSSPVDFMRRSLALTAILCASVTVMAAQAVSQSTTQTDAQSTAAVQTQELLTVQTPAIDTSGDALFSSSSAENAAAGPVSGTQQQASLKALPNLAEEMQYGGGRRRYGSPRYRGNNTNADGSSKYMFYAGAGFEQPDGNTWKYFTPSWGFQIGGGRQFSAHFAVPIEFDYDHFGLTRQAISNQAYIYTGDSNAADNGIDANMHVWSFSLDPRYTVLGSTSDGLGMYLLADVGFYHKVTSFTAPSEEEYCDPYYGCGIYEINSNFDHYTSNAPGFGAGIGFTYKFSHFSSERLYGEARYVFIDNSQRTGYNVADAVANVPYSGSDFFPANSNRTTYIPIKFGVRF